MSIFIGLREPTMFKVHLALILLYFSDMSIAQILAPVLLSAARLTTTTPGLAFVGEDSGALVSMLVLEQVELTLDKVPELDHCRHD